MNNIPTDLLRAFIAVVDLRSFTRAAQSLGVTQPAVSAQIRRLQNLLDGELLDKSAPGVTLTAKGEIVANYARRLLSINDQILDLSSQRKTIDRLRIGIPTDDNEIALLHLIAEFGNDHPEIQLQICTEPSDILLREFRRGEFDLVLAFAVEEQPKRPRWSWHEACAWGGASPTIVPGEGPIPLVVLGEGSLTRRISVKVLEEAGQPYEIAYVGKSAASLFEALASGLGVACWARRGLEASRLHILDHAPRLPKLADVSGGIYISEGREGSALNDLANRIAAVVRPPVHVTPAVARAGTR